MKLAVLHPDSGWILSMIARRVCQADPAHFTAYPFAQVFQLIPGQGYNVVVPEGVEGLVYADLQNCWCHQIRDFPSLGHLLHVGLMTHLDHDSVESFRLGWDRLDGVVHMCRRYFDVFAQQGWYPPERMTVLRPGQPVPGISLKPLRIGICQRGGHVGKGKDFLPAVAQAMRSEIRAGLHFVFCGQGWGSAYDEKAGCGTYHGIAATYLREAHYQALYEMVDLYLIPSLYEGGPMALLEALAAGLPVIAADVGWVRDFREDLCRRAGGWPLVGFSIYRPGNVGDLTGLLSIPVQDRLDRRAAVEGMSYKHYAAGLLAFCERLQEMRRG